MKQLAGCLALQEGSPLPNFARDPANDVTTSRMSIAAPVVWQGDSLTIAFEGAPRFGNDGGDDHVRRFAEAYRREGPTALDRLRGPFAIAVIDREANDAVLAIDRMGVHSLCWTVDGDTLIFGSSAAAVARGRAAGSKVNRQALFDFVMAHIVPAPDTAYSGVNKLLAGSYVRTQRGRMVADRYWTPDFERVESISVATLESQVLPTIERAIAHCHPGARTGTFLSGGLDSSTVTGMFAKSRSAAVDAFSVSFGVDDFNELAYARLASQRFGCSHHVYEVVPDDIVEAVPQIAAAYDEPFGNSSAVPTLCCARMAKREGFDHLLAGDGGDEIFGGNARYVRQKVFDAYGRVPLWLRRGALEPLAEWLDPETGLLPLRKFSSYVRQARVPLPERFETWNLVYREGPSAVFDAAFLDSVDQGHALKRMNECWAECPSGDLLDRMLWYDWKLTLADNDLRKVSQMCELAGVRVSYPMLDEELVDLSIKVPSAAKISGQELRTFFKQAVRDLLPAEIIRKQKHGFGLPFGVWLKTHKPLQDLVYRTLESVRERGILRRDFVDRVATEHRSGHAGYYGYAIWDMVMLEHWLQRQPAGSL